MSMRVPQNDPIGAYARKQKAARRVGHGRRCACGESRPEALIPRSKPTECAACQRKRRGRMPKDDHHPAAEANSPVTIPIPVNDHRADLNDAQHDWPKKTVENSDGSPLIAAAGCVRGFIDTVLYLAENLLLWVAEMLETADAFLVEKLGPKWWISTPIAQWAPQAERI